MSVPASSPKANGLQHNATQVEKTCPYVGPRPFERTEDHLFFGRDREARDVTSLIIANRTFILYSPSGAGKSSLLNTKIIHALEKEGCLVFPISRVQGQIPATVKDADIRNIFSLNAIMSVLAAFPQFKVNTRCNGTISTFVESVLSTRPTSDEPLVWIFDQFEELFSFYEHRWTERTVFVQELAEALEKFSDFKVVLSLREDYIAKLDAYNIYFPNKLRARFHLERLQERAAIDAVMRPVDGSGRRYDDGVPQAIVRDLLETHGRDLDGNRVTVKGEFVEPVQLQVVCLNLWDSTPKGVPLITKEQLEKSGSVDNALRKFYESAIADIVRQRLVSEQSLRRWFEYELITSAGTRGTVYRGTSTTAGLPNRVIDLLVDRHVIRGDWRAGAQWYEITHDRLVRPIQESNRIKLRNAERNSRLKLIGLSATLTVALLPALIFGIYWWNQQKITKVNFNVSWAVTNFRDYPAVGAISAMAAADGEKTVWRVPPRLLDYLPLGSGARHFIGEWGKPSVDPSDILATIAAALPANTIPSRLKQSKESSGFFIPGLKKFVFWSSADGVEIVSWDGKQRSNIPLNKLIDERQSSFRLENVAEGAAGTVLLRLTVANHQILKVLSESKTDPTTYDVDPTGYDTEYFISMSKRAKDPLQGRQRFWRLYTDRGVVYLFDYHRDSLRAEAFFMGDGEHNWTPGLGWIDYGDQGIAINSLTSFPQGMMVVRVYVVDENQNNEGLQFLIGGLKDIIAFDLQHGGKKVWSLSDLAKSYDTAFRCFGKFYTDRATCVFTHQDHGSSGLLAIQVPSKNQTTDIAQRAQALADLVVIDVTTGKTREVPWADVLAKAKNADLGAAADPSAKQITRNLTVGGTIDSLVITVPFGRVVDVFRIDNSGPTYVGTYTAPDLSGALYFSSDQNNMILISGQEAKIWDISKTVQQNAKSLLEQSQKSLSEGKGSELIQLSCKIVPSYGVLIREWSLSGRKDELPQIPCSAPL